MCVETIQKHINIYIYTYMSTRRNCGSNSLFETTSNDGRGSAYSTLGGDGLVRVRSGWDWFGRHDQL